MKELTLEITNRCYQNCPWCSSSSIPNGEHVDDRVFSFLKAYSDECDVVRFSGGEPTLHPRLPFFLKYADELGYEIVLMTNGLHMMNLFGKICNYVDEYIISVVNGHSIVEVLALRAAKQKVSMQAVLVEENEEWVRRSLDTSILYDIPVRLLVLQKQGRGVDCKPLDLISWTGNRGCNKDGKVTITCEGKVVSCSALKYGECSLELRE